MVSVYNIIYNSKKKRGWWGGHKLSLCELLNLFITSVGLVVCHSNLSNGMVIILVALPWRYYHAKIYNNSSVELSGDGLGECVGEGMECHKLPL